MKYATLLLGFTALAALSSCCQQCPCAASPAEELHTCSDCAGSGEHSSTATHLGEPQPHSAYCPASADHEIIYNVRPGT